jgi:DNA-binding NarL/FixJ family response regulator
MASVVLADSNELIRIGLRSVLQGLEAIDIIDEAHSNKDLLKKIANHQPDVVVIDYTSPEFSIDIIPSCIDKSKNTRFVAITYDQSSMTIINAIRSGVTSYIKKDCDLQEIKDAVVETAKGGKFFCGKILETIEQESIDVNQIELLPRNCAPVSLSARELEIIQLIAEGYTNPQIAEKLILSNHTITTHRKNIMAKLGVNNTAAIVMYAVKSRLVSPNKFLFTN